MHRELELGAGNTIQFKLEVKLTKARYSVGHGALPWLA